MTETTRTLLEEMRPMFEALVTHFKNERAQHPCTFECEVQRGMATARGESRPCSCAGIVGRRAAEHYLDLIKKHTGIE